MNDTSTNESNVSELRKIRITLRTWSSRMANRDYLPRTVNGGKPFVIRLKDQEMRTADDASLATQFA